MKSQRKYGDLGRREYGTGYGSFVTECMGRRKMATKEGVIVPILKKGGGEKVEEYRGVTLMSTLYKVYAAVLAERLREELKVRE